MAIRAVLFDIDGIGTIALRSGKFSDEALRAAGAITIYDAAAALLADFHNSPLAR
jgi:membrane protein